MSPGAAVAWVIVHCYGRTAGAGVEHEPALACSVATDVIRPAGTTGCSRGWSEDRPQAGTAQPVEEVAFRTGRPGGAEESLRRVGRTDLR